MADVFKVIFQLEAEGKGVLDEINKVGNAYKKVNTELKKQEKELNDLLKKEAEILAARKKTNSPSEAAKFNEALKKNKVAIDAATKSLNGLAEAEKNVVKEGETLGKKLDNAFKGTQVKSLSSQLKELKTQLATTDDDAEFLRLSVEAGKLEGKIGDASEAARIFATDSPFEAVGNAIGNVGSELINLDFEGAAKNSQLLVQASNKITFGNALTGLKQIGTTLFNTGKALLTNPLFLIGAAIVGIIANFEKLKSLGGPIGSVFKGIGDIIDGAVTMFFKLTDAIGLTTHALDGFNDSIIKNSKLLLEQQQKVADRRIAVAKAAGLETDKLEKESARNSIKLLQVQLAAYESRKKAHGSLTEDERKEEIEVANAILDQKNKVLEIDAAANKKRLDNAKKYAADIKQLFADLEKKLREEQTKTSEFNAKNNFGEGSLAQIKATFDIRKKLEADAFAELKANTLKEAKTKADKVKANLLLTKIANQQEINFNNDKNLAIIDANKNIAKAELDQRKATAEGLIAQSEDTEIGIAQLRLNVQQDSYNELIKLEEQNIAARKKLGVSTVDEEKALANLKLEAAQKNFESLKALGKLTTETALKQVDNQEATEQNRLKLINARGSTLLKAELDYEKQRLEILKAAGKEYSTEVVKQEDRVNQLRKEARKQEILEYTAYFEQIVGAAISATNKIIDAKIKEVEKQTELQTKRVEQAKEIAGEGNAELLQEEKTRLENLNKEKEKYVRQQQALATIELVANTAIAVSKAAAEGGVAAGITIAAALLALVAGLASARSIAGQAAYYEGGLYEGEGYTGSGNPREASNKVGRKPYIYHKDEFIFNHKNTRKYKDIFQGVHDGRIDLRDWSEKVRAFDSYNLKTEKHAHTPVINNTVEITELKEQMNTLITIMKNQNTSINIDDNGFAVHLKNVVSRNEFIKNQAS